MLIRHVKIIYLFYGKRSPLKFMNVRWSKSIGMTEPWRMSMSICQVCTSIRSAWKSSWNCTNNGWNGYVRRHGKSSVVSWKRISFYWSIVLRPIEIILYIFNIRCDYFWNSSYSVDAFSTSLPSALTIKRRFWDSNPPWCNQRLKIFNSPGNG